MGDIDVQMPSMDRLITWKHCRSVGCAPHLLAWQLCRSGVLIIYPLIPRLRQAAVPKS